RHLAPHAHAPPQRPHCYPSHPPTQPPTLSLFSHAPPTTELYTLSLHDALPIYSLTTRRRDGDRVGPGLDVVGDDAMRRAAQLGYALDLQYVRANTLDPGPHLAQKKCQVDDVRFAGGVVDRGDAISGGGHHHEIFRSRHRRH